MLKERAFRKIIITTVTLVILLMIYVMPENKTKSTLNVTPEVKYEDTKVGYIYLLNDNNLLVKVNVPISSYSKDIDEVKIIIDKLINGNLNPKGLKNIIPKKTKLISASIEDNVLKINFSKEILKTDEKMQDKLIEEICYSLFELKNINSISIYVDGGNINKYFKNVPDIITRDYGINKIYNIKNLKDIKKVILYYVSEIDDNKYMVPVTSYINDSEEKIKIIIESLSSNYIYEPNLISFLNSKTELINYEITDDIMMLNFNNSIFMNDGSILEEVVYEITNSVFDNYDVNKVIFNVENKTIREILR